MKEKEVESMMLFSLTATTAEISVTDIVSYIKPELLVVAVALYVMGLLLKKSQKFSDNNIPFALLLTAIVLTALYVLATSSVSSLQDVCMAVFTILVQAVLITGAAVLVSQLIIQTRKKSE